MMPAVSNTLVFKSDMGQLPVARAWAMEHACDAGLGEDDLFALELVLSEGVSNVVRHAYGGEPGNDIELELNVDDERFVLEIRDFGRPFDTGAFVPPAQEDPDLKVGGRGVELIHQLMDRVDADLSRPPGTLLCMVRFRTPEPTS